MLQGVITNATDWRSHALQGRCKFQGLPLSIENERGSYRQGIDEHGKTWRTFMHIAYGYIRLTEGTDGDHVDVYIGASKFSDRVFIVHQVDPVTKKYDEDKVMLGFNTPVEAKIAYQRQYDRPDYFGTMDEYDMATFKQMLKDRKGMKLKKSLESLEKAKRMPIGTVSHGRKKVAEGRWVDLPKGTKKSTEWRSVSLTAEAKKYKTAGAFIAALPKAYHGTHAEFEGFVSREDAPEEVIGAGGNEFGIYFSNRKEFIRMM